MFKIKSKIINVKFKATDSKLSPLKKNNKYIYIYIYILRIRYAEASPSRRVRSKRFYRTILRSEIFHKQ